MEKEEGEGEGRVREGKGGRKNWEGGIERRDKGGMEGEGRRG